MENFSHKPTTKHENKPFKSRHKTKGALKAASKGRTQKSHSVKASTKGPESKAARRNKAKQVLRAKNEASKHESNAPRVIAIVSLCPDVDLEAALSKLFPQEAVTLYNGICYVQSGHRLLQFLIPSYNDLMGNLDACLAADYVILCLSSAVEVEYYGENLLRCLTSLGVGEAGIRACLPFLPEDESSVTHTHIRKSLLSFANHFFPSLDKIYALDAPSEVSNLVRSFKETSPKSVAWREERARLLVEDAAFAEGSLQLTGTIRGAPLNVNHLLHIPGYGDAQISSVARAVPYSSAAKGKHRHVPNGMDIELSTVLAEADPEDADDLQSINELGAEELLQAEQTWPTEEEMQGAPHGQAQHALPDARPGTTPRHIKRVPKGTSEYQAAWILNDGSGTDADSITEGDDSEQDEEMASASDAYQSEGDMDEATEQTPTLGDPDVDPAAYEAYRSRRRIEARDDADFPDEVDTPQDRMARERFAKYRGLKSFRTSAWDPFENLPLDYSKCFMFENYKSMSRGVVNRAGETGIEVGTRVVVHLKGVSQDALAVFQKPTTVFGLHKHEHKITVMHFSVLRNTEYEDEVRSKDPVILVLGPRRFLIEPLFSQHTQKNGGKGSNNVHKFHRFVQQGVSLVGSAYLPVTFGSSTPALLLQPDSLDLISSGSLLSSDPTRVIAKRLILTGHPYKLHKRTATIRYMFFNVDDIHYFKPIELHTKKGRKGHIKESLGTHGFFKAAFDGPIDQMDTVCLNLYKRCFPKWGRLLKYEGAAKDGQAGEDVDMAL